MQKCVRFDRVIWGCKYWGDIKEEALITNKIRYQITAIHKGCIARQGEPKPSNGCQYMYASQYSATVNRSRLGTRCPKLRYKFSFRNEWIKPGNQKKRFYPNKGAKQPVVNSRANRVARSSDVLRVTAFYRKLSGNVSLKCCPQQGQYFCGAEAHLTYIICTLRFSAELVRH